MVTLSSHNNNNINAARLCPNPKRVNKTMLRTNTTIGTVEMNVAINKVNTPVRPLFVEVDTRYGLV